MTVTAKWAVRHFSCYVNRSDIRNHPYLSCGALFIVEATEGIFHTILESESIRDFICSSAFEMQNDNGTDKVCPEYPSMTYGDILVITDKAGNSNYEFCDRVGWKSVDKEFYDRWMEMDDALERQRFGSQYTAIANA